MAGDHGKVGVEQFAPEYLTEESLNDIARRVTVTIDEGCESDYPRLRSAKVRITSKQGQHYDHYIDEPLGSARHPLSDAALQSKFLSLAEPVCGATKAAQLAELVGTIEERWDVDILITEMS